MALLIWAIAIVALAAQQDVPINRTPQNLPCGDQPRSVSELMTAFNRGRLPSASALTGSWVSIGLFGEASSHGVEIRSLNCDGITRGNWFEHVLIADGYAIETHAIGASDQFPTAIANARKGELSFELDFGGGRRPVFRCRTTDRQTLVCLVDLYREAFEFRKMIVPADKIFSSWTRGDVTSSSVP